jgi:MFS family permease
MALQFFFSLGKSSLVRSLFHGFSLARRLRNLHVNSICREVRMNKHLFQGVFCGGIFAAAITWIAASDAMTEGGLALLASAVFGLAAGLCIGGLIAANFAMLAVEEKENKEALVHRTEEAPATA